MKHLPTFASFIAVALAAGYAYGRRLPWPIWSYLVAQTIFAVVGWWVLQRSAASTRDYLIFFASYSLVLVFSLITVLCWPLNGWILLPLIPALAVSIFFAGLQIYRGNPLVMVLGGTWILCGILTVLSFGEAQSTERRYAAIACGTFWLCGGVWAWIYAANGSRWNDLNYFGTPFLALVCFAWLAVMLSGAQPEAATQHSEDESQMSEMQVMEAGL